MPNEFATVSVTAKHLPESPNSRAVARAFLETALILFGSAVQ